MITTTKTKTNFTMSVVGKIKSKKQQYLVSELVKYDLSKAIQYINSFGKKSLSSTVTCSLRDIKRNLTVVKGYDTLKIKQPGYWLNRYNSMFNCSNNHSPTSKNLGDWIGVEIECSVPYASLYLNPGSCQCYCEDCGNDYSMCGCGHDCEDQGADTDDGHSKLITYLNKRKIKFCSVKSDGSINPESGCFPVELTIVFNKNDREPLKRLCKALNELGAKVNKSCGMHVHLDQRDQLDRHGKLSGLKIMKRGRSLGACLNVFSKIVPKSRIGNTYCKLMVSGFKHNRYSAVNMTAVSKHKTIEVRLHSATTDFIKINNWIDLLLIVQDSKLTRYNNVQTLDDLCMSVDVPEKLIAYIEQRITKFASKPETEEDDTSVNLELENVLVEPVVTPPQLINSVPSNFFSNGIQYVWNSIMNEYVAVATPRTGTDDSYEIPF